MSEVIAKVTTIDNGRIEGELIGKLVRCKDCKHGHMCINGKREPMVKCELLLDEWLHDPDWFCADGERKQGAI